MWSAGWSWNPERTLLNNVIDQAQAEVSGLDTRVTALTREVAMLRTIVDVLIGALRDTNAINDDVLSARLENALEPFHPPPQATVLGAEAPPRPITCIRCRGVFDPAQTMMTADGAMCDSCSAKP